MKNTNSRSLGSDPLYSAVETATTTDPVRELREELGMGVPGPSKSHHSNKHSIVCQQWQYHPLEGTTRWPPRRCQRPAHSAGRRISYQLGACQNRFRGRHSLSEYKPPFKYEEKKAGSKYNFVIECRNFLKVTWIASYTAKHSRRLRDSPAHSELQGKTCSEESCTLVIDRLLQFPHQTTPRSHMKSSSSCCSCRPN